MTIANKGLIGTVGNGTNGSNINLTTTADLLNTEFAVMQIVTNNIQTTDGTSNNHSSIVGSFGAAWGYGGTWTKLYEYTNGGAGVAAGGVTMSLWLIYGAYIPSGSGMQIDFSGNIVDKVAQLWGFTKTLGGVQSATSPVGTSANGTTSYAALALSGLSSKQRLYFRGIGKELNATSQIAPSSNFTAVTPQRSRANVNAVMLRGEYRINTSTGETSNPTQTVNPTTGDTTDIFVAIEEFGSVPQTYSQIMM